MRKVNIFAKICCFIIAFAFVFSISATASSTQIAYIDLQFSDVQSDDWFYNSVKTVFQYGLMNGTSSTTFSPNDRISTAECIALAVRLHGIYTNNQIPTGNTEPWYSGYIEYAVQNGILLEGEYHVYTYSINRLGFVELIDRAVPQSQLSPINEVLDGSIPGLTSNTSYYESVYRLYRAGILTGVDDAGTFDEFGTITRSEVAAIISRVVVPELRKTFILNGEGTAVLESDGADCYPNTAYKTFTEITGTPLEDISVSEDNKVEYLYACRNYNENGMTNAKQYIDNYLVVSGFGMSDISSKRDNLNNLIYYDMTLTNGIDTFHVICDNSNNQVVIIPPGSSDTLIENEGTSHNDSQNLEVDRITTIDELEAFLNANLHTCETPMGTFTYEHTIRERTYDFVIETAHVNCVSPWYDIQYSDIVPEDVVEQTLSELRQFQKQVYQIVSSAFPNQAFAGGFCDRGYKYPNIKVDPYVITALSWANHSYTGQDTTYSFYWDTSRDLYDFNSGEESTDIEKDVSTIEGLENYLNTNLNTCETPMGTYSLKFTVEENTYSFNGWDIEILTEGNYSVLPWAEINSSIKYTDEEKEETLEILKNIQKEIYEIASEAFPDKKLTGCYFSDWYKYPSLEVGYETDRHLTWTNYTSDSYAHDYNSTYITSFHWDDWRDD